MSVQATTWVWEHSEASGNQRLVLLAIADAANREGEQSFQSVPSIARMSRVSESTVRRAMKALVEMGELEATGTHPKYQTVVYRLPKMGGVNLTPPVTSDTPVNLTPLSNEPPTPVTTVTPNPSNPSKRSTSNPSSSSSDSKSARGDEASSTRQVHHEPRPLPADWKPRWKPDEHTWEYAVTRIEHYGVDLIEVAENMVLWARDQGREPSSSLYRTFLDNRRDKIIEMENRLERQENPRPRRPKWYETA